MLTDRTTVINISLPERLLHLADERAEAESRSRSDLFREAVRRYLGLTTVVAAHQESNAADMAPAAPSAGFDYEHNPTWRIFQILAEFVDGFHFLSQFHQTVTVFGSARAERDSPYYRQAVELGTKLARAGFTIITGGGPGIMEAANKGAVDGAGQSVALNIQLPMEQRTNPYVQRATAFNFFFTRKVMLNASAQAYVFFPGGYGTLDEFFELITLEQTGKVERYVPIVLVGREFWQPLCDWMSHELTRRGMIAEPDVNLWSVVDSIDDAVKLITASKPRNRFIYSSKEAHVSGDDQIWSQ